MSGGKDQDYQALQRTIAELQVENERLLHALNVILPMAKGYAAEHQVGRNNQIVLWAECIANGQGQPA